MLEMKVQVNRLPPGDGLEPNPTGMAHIDTGQHRDNLEVSVPSTNFGICYSFFISFFFLFFFLSFLFLSFFLRLTSSTYSLQFLEGYFAPDHIQ